MAQCVRQVGLPKRRKNVDKYQFNTLESIRKNNKIKIKNKNMEDENKIETTEEPKVEAPVEPTPETPAQ